MLDDASFRFRHRLISGLLLTWASWIFSIAMMRGLGAEHAAVEALLPTGFAIVSLWSWPSRWHAVGLATAGLGTAHAITIHLLEGSFLAHALFFPMSAMLLLYCLPITNLFLTMHILLLHGILAAMDPHAVYGHRWDPTAKAALVASQIAWLGLLTLSTRIRPGRRQRRLKKDDGTVGVTN